MHHLPSYHWAKWREVFWQGLRVLPITRGCWWVDSSTKLEGLSYERLLEDVRSSQVGHGPERIRELLRKYIYQPVEGEVNWAVTECRVDEAERFLNKLVYGEGLGLHKYAVCPEGHIC